MKNIAFKIFISVLLLCLIATIATSCVSDQNNLVSNYDNSLQNQNESISTKENISGNEDIWTDRKLTVGYITPGALTSWYTTLAKNIVDTAKEWNINLIHYDSEGKHDLQIEQVRLLINKKVDVIAICAGILTGWDEVLNEAQQAGIPIILIQHGINVTDKTLYSTYIEIDNYEQGNKAGEHLIRYLKNNDKSNSNIRIVEMRANDDAVDILKIGEAFREVIKDFDNLDIIESLNGWYTGQPAYEKMKEYLITNKEINVLFSQGDEMTEAAIQAIEETGLVPGEDILIISVDGSDKILEYIVGGKVLCSVERNPRFGPLLMEACVRLANGEEIEREIHPVDRVFDITNAQAELDAREENGYGY